MLRTERGRERIATWQLTKFGRDCVDRLDAVRCLFRDCVDRLPPNAVVQDAARGADLRSFTCGWPALICSRVMRCPVDPGGIRRSQRWSLSARQWCRCWDKPHERYTGAGNDASEERPINTAAMLRALDPNTGRIADALAVPLQHPPQPEGRDNSRDPEQQHRDSQCADSHRFAPLAQTLDGRSRTACRNCLLHYWTYRREVGRVKD